jgi:hypothetical protein
MASLVSRWQMGILTILAPVNVEIGRSGLSLTFRSLAPLLFP